MSGALIFGSATTQHIDFTEETAFKIALSS